MKNLGVFLPSRAPSSDRYTPQWLEEHFTHYLGEDAFVWADPRKEIPDGKILRGAKVLLGKQEGAFSLICTRTPDSAVMNMYVSSPALRDRAQGPPPPAKPDDD